ncbi:Acetolactate synthase large subunit [Propionispora sp. 2/2-37]|uniref:biosynthetic-type acetolactate synthase large subunit n=1 Tax=Propionispora sp. 2/2-37 TaxID=1677858 RepID=UPI0006BB59A5|nr:biosynthetic-type acetolactate synthase large subunit [Propionispora sp. 2/2-37]CUH94900.1 Acetolactate synthase large subunit [Propionispora sp. 2/2-37]
MKMRGAEAIIKCLEAEAVDVVFGYPGGAVLTLYDALYKLNFPHILARHEQGAVHAADGYARATGKVGVCIATSGPGATNLVTGIATAYMDSVPLVAITGQVGVSLIGKDSFQEADIRGITTPVSKHNYLVKKVEELPRVLKEAFYIAKTGRPGPVVVDISKDVFNAELDFEYPKEVKLRGYHPVADGNPQEVDAVVEELLKAEKPLIFVGGGINISGACQELACLQQLTGIPVTASLMGLGCVSGESLYLGMLGMHGTYASNMAVTECDVLLGIGVRFDDRVTGSVPDFAAGAKIIHFDIDPAEINKNIRADFRVAGDLRWSLPLLCEKIRAVDLRKWKEQLQPWCKQLATWKQEKPLTYDRRDDVIMPQAVIEKVSELTQGSAVIVTDVGQHQMWTAQFYDFSHSRSFLTSGGLGTMGYGLPAAVGAQVGLRDQMVILFTGDGGIMMNCQEMVTAADNELPVKIIVMNNQVLGMVSQWQRMFYGGRYSYTSLKGKTDFVKLAEAMGVTGMRISRPQDLEPMLREAFAIPGPVLVEVRLPEEEDVLPMVPAGGRLNQMILEGGCTGK